MDSGKTAKQQSRCDIQHISVNSGRTINKVSNKIRIIGKIKDGLESDIKVFIE